MKTIESQHWIITLPDNWDKKENDDQLYFENSQNTMGLYISTLSNNKNNKYELIDIETFLKIDKEQLSIMKGYRFNILFENILKKQNLIFGILDIYDPIKFYRIYVKYIAHGIICSRFSFHDYSYNEDSTSEQIKNLIIDSAKLKVS